MDSNAMKQLVAKLTETCERHQAELDELRNAVQNQGVFNNAVTERLDKASGAFKKMNQTLNSVVQCVEKEILKK